MVRPFLQPLSLAEVRGISLQTSVVRYAAWVSRPPTVGAATAIGWWRCSGCLDYVMMDSVREKEEKEGKTAAMVGVFVLPEREKRAFSVAFASLLCLSLQ